MADERSVLALTLEKLRRKYRVPIPELAAALGRKHKSGWQYYETRVVGPYLNAKIAKQIAPVFERYKCPPSEIWQLTGADLPEAPPGGGTRDELLSIGIEAALEAAGVPRGTPDWYRKLATALERAHDVLGD